MGSSCFSQKSIGIVHLESHVSVMKNWLLLSVRNLDEMIEIALEELHGEACKFCCLSLFLISNDIVVEKGILTLRLNNRACREKFPFSLFSETSICYFALHSVRQSARRRWSGRPMVSDTEETMSSETSNRIHRILFSSKSGLISCKGYRQDILCMKKSARRDSELMASTLEKVALHQLSHSRISYCLCSC